MNFLYYLGTDGLVQIKSSPVGQKPSSGVSFSSPVVSKKLPADKFGLLFVLNLSFSELYSIAMKQFNRKKNS